MRHSLWFKLSIVFFLLTLFSVTVLARIPGLILIYDRFKIYITPEHISAIIRTTQPLLAEGVKADYAAQVKWLELANTELHDKLINFKSPNGEFYLGFAAQRSLYYRVYGLDNSILTSSPNSFSGEIEKIFAVQGLKSRESNNDQEYWTNEDQIWISQALYDIDGRPHGRVDVLFNVQYDYMQALRQLGQTYSNIWYYLILFFSFIGIACGIAANLFVMRRLRVMNNVTSVWCQGNLSPRIPVNDKSTDILSSHSRILNMMADDLQSLFDLRYRAAIAEERGRVARELHDTVKQNLFALKLQLAAIKQKNCDTEISNSIDEARKIIHESQNDIMTILAQLNSSMSGQRGFYERLAVLSENMRRHYHLETVWEAKEEVSLSPGEEMTVTRIAQEVMANAARHGRAIKIVMNAVKRNGMIQWTIRDNGFGFQQDKAVLSSGLGLIFLRQRAWDLPEGEFAIGGHPDGGTEVKITWRAI